jgi:hypothetical protein
MLSTPCAFARWAILIRSTNKQCGAKERSKPVLSKVFVNGMGGGEDSSCTGIHQDSGLTFGGGVPHRALLMRLMDGLLLQPPSEESPNLYILIEL